jgi:hypothetical protein
VLGRQLPRVMLEAWPSIRVYIARQWRTASVIMTTLPGRSESGALAERTVVRMEAWRALSCELLTSGYDLALLTSRSLAERHRSVGDLDFGHTLPSDVGVAR